MVRLRDANSQRFSFLGDSGNWGLAFLNSSGIGEYETGEFLRKDPLLININPNEDKN